MDLSPSWIVALASGGVGAAVLAAAAAMVRREIAELQRSMRPLRLGRPRRPSAP